MRSSVILDSREFRYSQLERVVSAAAAVTVRSTLAPSRSIRVIRFAVLYSSDAEVARRYTIGIESGGLFIGIQSTTAAVDFSELFPYCLGQETQELVLFPGEGIRGEKDAAGAGETLILQLGFIDYAIPTLARRVPKPVSREIGRGAPGGGGGGFPEAPGGMEGPIPVLL